MIGVHRDSRRKIAAAGRASDLRRTARRCARVERPQAVEGECRKGSDVLHEPSAVVGRRGGTEARLGIILD